MKVEVRKQSEFEWSVYVDGERIIDRESYTVANNIAWHLENPAKWDYSESCEVASQIRSHRPAPGSLAWFDEHDIDPGIVR